MSRYRQPDPPPRSVLRVVGRVLLWLALAIAVLAVALVAGIYLWFHESVAAVRAHSEDAKAGPEVPRQPPPPGHAAIALVIGYDHRANEAVSDPSRSDTIMLLRADPATKTVSMLSFPRDLIVNVQCPGQPAYSGKINSAYATCGSKGTLQTVRDLIGLPINYLITVNFRGLQGDRQPARRGLDRRRPPVLQRQRRREPGFRVRDDQPASRVPAAHRRQRARLRALPAHRLRPLPDRAPAAVREGDEVPARPQLLDHARCRRSSGR